MFESNKERRREEPIIVVISAVTSLFQFKIGTKQYTVRYEKIYMKVLSKSAKLLTNSI